MDDMIKMNVSDLLETFRKVEERLVNGRVESYSKGAMMTVVAYLLGRGHDVANTKDPYKEGNFLVGIITPREEDAHGQRFDTEDDTIG